MLIEIHMIQNHSPSNLNRDDLGAPKTCIFGGVTRARISSQCLKRSIRRSSDFQRAMEADGGVRTRRLITILAEKAHGSAPAPEELIDFVAKAFEKGGLKRDPTKDDPNATNILMFLPASTINAMAEAVQKEWRKPKGDRDPDSLASALSESLDRPAAVPDIALFGRMTELDSNGLFRKLDFHVEAALSAAHAISTHEAINEVDYFTAVDDCAKGTGAGHVNEAMYASACFYKYFCVDWDQLLKNLGGDVKLAQFTVSQFIYGAAMSTPSGKQKSFAAYNLPEGILVEIKTGRSAPISYANAFANPVPLKSSRGLIAESVARLGQHVHEIAQGYGIKAERFWFSPGGRHCLKYIDPQAGEHEKERPVVEGDRNVQSLDTLISNVMKAVADAAQAYPAETAS
jgi:CRISPR system Cascade subunit CasC